METVVVKFPDYWQEHLPETQRTFHYEVRRNFGTSLRPWWETVKFFDTEEQANDWARTN